MKLTVKNECGREWEGKVKDRTRGLTTNTKGKLKMKPYYYGSFLKQVHIKRNLNGITI